MKQQLSETSVIEQMARAICEARLGTRCERVEFNKNKASDCLFCPYAILHYRQAIAAMAEFKRMLLKE